MEPEYKASEEQLKSLVEKSTKCEQSINIDCVNTPLKTLSGENAWWTDYRGKSNSYHQGYKDRYNLNNFRHKIICVF